MTNAGAPDSCGEDGPPAKTLMRDRQVSYEGYIAIAERAMPGYQAVFLSFPSKAGMSVGVKLKGANDWHRVGLSNVYLEPATGQVIAVNSFPENNAATKFLKLMLPFHFGRFGERFGLGSFGLYAVMIDLCNYRFGRRRSHGDRIPDVLESLSVETSKALDSETNARRGIPEHSGP